MSVIDTPSRMSAAAQEVAPNVYRLPTGISNVYFVAIDADDYVLIDAGPKGYGERILDTAAELFGAARPRAILLTHGHFDHAGGLPRLLQEWPEVPVFAHALELPYVNGDRRYPPGDPTVGGVMAEMSRFLDTSKPTHVPAAVRSLPDDVGELEMLPGWEFRPSPGHTPGHVSYWNGQHRILISGDAIVTMNQYNPVKALSQTPELSAPPPYATYNWHHARQSARSLADLEPFYLCAGHGVPMHGDELAGELRQFVQEFPAPSRGRYLATPARFNRQGPVYVPPAPVDYVKHGAIAATSVLTAVGLYMLLRPRRAKGICRA